MFLDMSVSHFVKGGCLSSCMLLTPRQTTPGQTPPSRQTTPWANTPLNRPSQADTPGQPPPRILWDTVNKRVVCMLLECIFVLFTPTNITK